MTPSDRKKHLDSIKWLLEGLALLVDIQLPKGAQTTRGWPAVKKLQKTEPRDPSGFEYDQPKKPKLQVKEDNNTQVKAEKKTWIQPSHSSSIKKKPVQSTRKIQPPPEAPHLIQEIPSMAKDYI